VVNPLGVEAQMMGATIDGVSTALNLAITVKDGQVQQHNFTDYPLLRMAQAPQSVEVHIVESSEEPSGAGEIGVPRSLPALANAIYAATTVRVRKLPHLARNSSAMLVEQDSAPTACCRSGPLGGTRS
jgi:isoquinoline 1-oxidoreductase beta subunit